MILPRYFESDLLDLLGQAARKDILPAYRSTDKSNTHCKTTAHDIVTHADIAAEKRITAAMKSILPGALIIGEEAVSENPDSLDKIGLNEFTVLVDPIDGTLNFVSGLPMFSTMIAVMHGNETIFGCIYDPLTGEALIAEKGRGTRIICALGLPETYAQTDQTKLGLSSTGFLNCLQYPKELRPMIFEMTDGIGYTRSLQCSAFEYRLTATGTSSYNVSRSAKPWDHAAGALAVTEAGGTVNFMDGSPYSPMCQSGPIVAGGSDEICADLMMRLGFLKESPDA